MFGLFKKKKPKYPIVTTEMMQPTDADISTTDAKKFFREYAKQTGFLDRDEISDHVEYLAEEIRGSTYMLKDTVDEYKEDIADIKKDISQLKKKLKTQKAKEDEDYRDDIEAQIEDLEADLEPFEDDLEAAKKKYSAFRKDKREFIIDYINTQVHGPD